MIDYILRDYKDIELQIQEKHIAKKSKFNYNSRCIDLYMKTNIDKVKHYQGEAYKQKNKQKTYIIRD